MSRDQKLQFPVFWQLLRLKESNGGFISNRILPTLIAYYTTLYGSCFIYKGPFGKIKRLIKPYEIQFSAVEI